MSDYTASDIKEELEEAGELLVVLESGVEYELHLHDTEFSGDPDATTLGDLDDKQMIETEGLVDGEYRVVRFPAGKVEHTYIHKES